MADGAEIDSRLEGKLGFDRVRKMIADRCSTSYAVDRVEKEVFSTDAKEIRHRLLLTDEMRLIVMFEQAFPTSGYIDCFDFLLPLSHEGHSIDLVSLGKLRTMSGTVRKITGFFSSLKDGVYPTLGQMVSKVEHFPEVDRRIDSILDRYGNVRDSASPALQDIRRQLKEKEGAISKRAAAVLKKAIADGYAASDANIAMRDGTYLIPVNSASKRKVSGFVHDESSSGKTTFIQPAEIVELENEVAELRFSETREIARILDEFSDFVRPYVPQLIESAGFMGEIDFLLAKAQVALDFKAGMPLISENGEMNLRKARHPLLERALKKEQKEIVPLTVILTPAKHILLISGPNAGGKSVALKTTGLLQYMFQWGMLIPTSETSELPVLRNIMVSIGDDQSLENDLSTYSSFLSDMKEMLEDADSGTLVLIDEFGSGTEPAAGGAIACAILAELDRKGVYGVITTHYTDLKLYASGSDTGVINGAMAFDAKNIAPLFKLEIGLPGNSFAFEMARKMGLPEKVVSDAESRAGEGFVGMERNLRRIARSRRTLDEKLQKIKSTDKTLESITDRYQKELEDIRQVRKDILAKAHAEAAEIVSGANRQVENTIRTIKESQAEKEATRHAREELQDFVGALMKKKEQTEKERQDYLDKKLKQLEARRARQQARKLERADERTRKALQEQEEERMRMEEFRNAPLKIGEKVRVKDNGMVGEVVFVTGRTVTITVGNIRSRMPSERVERISSNEFKAAVKEVSKTVVQRNDAAIAQRKAAFKMELDVRGERVSEAMDIVSRYIDDAIMLNVESVRIIHGKGTGALRDEIQKYVRTVPGVASARDEQIQFGGTGVTVVTFER